MERKEKLQLIKDTAFELIEEERLTKPNKITMRNSLSGVRKRYGALTKSRHRINGKERISIVVNTIEARFYEDPKGRFRDKKGNRFSRYLTGKKIDIKEIVHTMAHEIAHIKFWNHTPQHHSYTDSLNLRLVEMLEGKGVSISE